MLLLVLDEKEKVEGKEVRVENETPCFSERYAINVGCVLFPFGERKAVSG
jgi:hypothetical protein